jgi:hypothetical protein
MSSAELIFSAQDQFPAQPALCGGAGDGGIGEEAPEEGQQERDDEEEGQQGLLHSLSSEGVCGVGGR